MKKIILFLLMASPGLAAGPKHSFNDPLMNDEFENIYHDIDSLLRGNVRISSVTISTLTIVNLRGVTDGSSACSGCIGERIESTVAASARFNVAATTVWGDITSISLTAGDWDVTGQIFGDVNNSTNWTATAGAISAYSGNTITDHIVGDNETANTNTGPNFTLLTLTGWRVSITSTTSIYLKARNSFGNGSILSFGRISARRMR